MDIADKLVDEMPGVQENAIEQLDNEKEQQKAGFRDKMGRAFDKLMHLTTEDGEPKLTKSGRLRIRRGFGPDAKTPKQSTIGGLDTPPGITFADGQRDGEAEILATGQSAASLTFLVGMFAFKEAGKPTKDEVNQVTYAYQTYFRAKNIRDLPPGVILATALMTYAGPRLILPETRKRSNKLWTKVKKRFSKGRVTPDKQTESITDKES